MECRRCNADGNILQYCHDCYKRDLRIERKQTINKVLEILENRKQSSSGCTCIEGAYSLEMYSIGKQIIKEFNVKE